MNRFRCGPSKGFGLDLTLVERLDIKDLRAQRWHRAMPTRVKAAYAMATPTLLVSAYDEARDKADIAKAFRGEKSLYLLNTLRADQERLILTGRSESGELIGLMHVIFTPLHAFGGHGDDMTVMCGKVWEPGDSLLNGGMLKARISGLNFAWGQRGKGWSAMFCMAMVKLCDQLLSDLDAEKHQGRHNLRKIFVSASLYGEDVWISKFLEQTYERVNRVLLQRFELEKDLG